jgi:hypothetical protein
VDRKGNSVIEKDVHREGIPGSTDAHTRRKLTAAPGLRQR